MDVSILLPTRNEVSGVSRSLPRIFTQSYPGQFEVIMVDSGSTDGTLRVARAYPVRVIRIRPEQFHHARTRNLAAEAARGRALVYLNADAVPVGPDWLSDLVSGLEREGVAAVYGRQLPDELTDPVNRFRTQWNYGARPVVKNLGTLPELGTRTFFFSTVNCAIRRSVWRRFRFPEWVPVDEDAAFATQVIRAGYSILYEPRAAVQHAHNLTPADVFRRYFDTAAVYKKLRVFDASGRGVGGEGVRFVLGGVWSLCRSGRPTALPRFASFVAGGLLGLVLGRRHERLPARARRWCSQYRRVGRRQE